MHRSPNQLTVVSREPYAPVTARNPGALIYDEFSLHFTNKLSKLRSSCLSTSTSNFTTGRRIHPAAFNLLKNIAKTH